jgi:hypothetical protein
MIYTNNQGPSSWAKNIIGYFQEKLNYKLFDQIIAAFKIKGKHVELCRTTHMKTHEDLLRCTQVPDDTHICFLDDVFYPGMNNDNLYYINIKPYVHDISFDVLISRLVKSNILELTVNDYNDLQKHLLFSMQQYNYTYVNKNKKSFTVDKILSKKILHHLHDFFNIKITKTDPKNYSDYNKTRRNKNSINKTRKIRNKLS